MTKAILPVSFCGRPAPLYELMELAEQHGILVVEDACQAATVEIGGVELGNIAHITVLSWSGKPICAPSVGGGAGNLPQAVVVGHLSKRLKGRFLAFGSE